jgi:magnesium transporter
MGSNLTMLTIYSNQGKNRKIKVSELNYLKEDQIVWADLENPTREEEAELESILNIDLPTREDMKDIEPSSRLYRENKAVYMTATLVWHADKEEPESTNVGFVLTKEHLITIRYADPKPFAMFAAYIEKQPQLCLTPQRTLLNLLETIVDRVAEILEQSSSSIDKTSRRIFINRAQKNVMRSSLELTVLLQDIARSQHLISKVHDSLVTLARKTSYLATEIDKEQGAEDDEKLKTIGRDIQSLIEHANHLSSNVSFQLDACLGLISMQQNGIIKIFSVAAVVFLPPTLIASVYGMNFEKMPELQWAYGYPAALIAMILAAVVPYIFFKMRGWL